MKPQKVEAWVQKLGELALMSPLPTLETAGAPTCGGGPFDADPIAGVLGDPSKRAVAAQVIGQAYVTAHNLATLNRQAIERIADALEEKREIMGDELLDLLDSQGIRIPDIDYGDEAVWPPIEFSVAIGRGGPGTAPAALPEPAAPASNGEPS